MCEYTYWIHTLIPRITFRTLGYNRVLTLQVEILGRVRCADRQVLNEIEGIFGTPIHAVPTIVYARTYVHTHTVHISVRGS